MSSTFRGFSKFNSFHFVDLSLFYCCLTFKISAIGGKFSWTEKENLGFQLSGILSILGRLLHGVPVEWFGRATNRI